MEIINELTASKPANPFAAIALGTFDGVHAGHQRIIYRAVGLSRQMLGKSMVFTSIDHPLSCIFPAGCPRSLTKSQEKAGLIRNLGVDCLVQIAFSPEFLTITPEKFIDLLHRNFEPKCIVVGSNYTFGYKGAGTVATLRALSRHYGYRLEIPASVTCNGTMVSSTEIRRLISTGSLAAAEQMLKRPVQLTGYIQSLIKRRSFPNEYRVIVEVEESMAVPCDGFYNVDIAADNVRNARAMQVRLIRSMSMKKGILRIELQFSGASTPFFNSENGCFAKIVFHESLVDEKIAAEG